MSDADWIEWSGGENPVGDAVVEAKWRNGRAFEGEASDTAQFDWEHRGDHCDIIAYRVVSEPPKPTPIASDAAGGLREQIIAAIRDHVEVGEIGSCSIDLVGHGDAADAILALSAPPVHVEPVSTALPGDDDDHTLATACRKYNIGTVKRLHQIMRERATGAPVHAREAMAVADELEDMARCMEPDDGAIPCLRKAAKLLRDHPSSGEDVEGLLAEADEFVASEDEANSLVRRLAAALSNRRKS